MCIKMIDNGFLISCANEPANEPSSWCLRRISSSGSLDGKGSTTWKGIQFTGQSILQLVFGNPTRKRGSNGNPRLRVGLPF